MSQTARLLAYLRQRPTPPSSLDIVQNLGILNTTGRISDLRARGLRIDCIRDERGVDRYHLVEAPVQLRLDGAA